MSLPWVPFNFGKYFTDTLHLDNEGHGAYILLIGHYYLKESPIRDDDRTLASLTKLPMDRWLALRPIMEEFFQIRDGYWHHGHCDDVIRDAYVTYNATKQRTAAATAARQAKRGVTSTSSEPSQPTSRTTSRKDITQRQRHEKRDDQRDVDVTNSVTSTQEQEQRMVEEGDARAREPASLTEIEDSLTCTQPVSMGTPIDHWQPAFVHPVDLDLLNQFCAIHEERGTFSKDWPTLWQAFLDEAKAPPPEPAKPKRRTAPPRVETNKRPEQPIGVRVLISEDAYALAKAVTAAMGVDGLPITVGMPAQMQTWMAAWPPDLILLTIQQVMARRPNDPPGSLKYFENAIARAFAESKRPLPVATVAPPSEVVTHVQRTEAKSISGAADRLIARIAAGGDGRPDDGSDESQAVAGPVPKIGRG